MFFYLESNAQSLSGVIRDAITGEAIVGANVVIKGTLKGASTDINGTYTIPVEPGEYS